MVKFPETKEVGKDLAALRLAARLSMMPICLRGTAHD
jgi:hypothetical protein